MSTPQFLVKLALAAACVVLTAVVIVRGEACIKAQKNHQQAQPADNSAQLVSEYRKNEAEVADLRKALEKQQTEMQDEVRKLQAKIAAGPQLQQAYSSLIKEIAGAAYDSSGKVKNERLKDLLVKNGWNLTSPTPAPSR